MNPTESRTRACKLAESMGWFLGQAENRQPVLHRPGKSPKTFATWLIALTYLMGQRELLPRGEARNPEPAQPPARVPVAQHAPPIPVARPAEIVPMARIVRVDSRGRIIG